MSDWLVVDELAPDVADAVLAPLYEAAARGELSMPFCGACGVPLELDQDVCDACRAREVAWRGVEPRGIVHSSTLVHRREAGLILVDHPYPVLDVELDSGHRVVMTTLTSSTTAPGIGDPVEVGFRHVGSTAVPAARVVRAQLAEEKITHPEATIPEGSS